LRNVDDDRSDKCVCRSRERNENGFFSREFRLRSNNLSRYHAEKINCRGKKLHITKPDADFTGLIVGLYGWTALYITPFAGTKCFPLNKILWPVTSCTRAITFIRSSINVAESEKTYHNALTTTNHIVTPRNVTTVNRVYLVNY